MICLLCATGQPSFGAEPAGSNVADPEVGFPVTVWIPLEGSAVHMRVILTAASDATVTVDYATQPPPADARYPAAQAGSDYVHTQGTLTFEPGETTERFRITLPDDSVYEGLEQFGVGLSNPQGAPLLTAFTTANVFVTDSEEVPDVVMSDATDVESAGELAFPVILSREVAFPVTMSYSTSNGTAVSGQDYTAAMGTLSFAPGQTRKTIEVSVTDDDRDEASTETFLVNLRQSHPDLNQAVGDQSATGTILDDDGGATLAIEDAWALEGDGVLSFLVVLGGRANGNVTVDYATADVTATAGADYASTMGTLTFAAGDTRKTVTVRLTGDNRDENEETLSLSLSREVGAVVVGSGVATGTIIDDDDLPRMTIRGAESDEGGRLDFVVSFWPASGLTVTVDFETDADFTQQPAPVLQLADADSDYVHHQGMLSFAPGETSKTIRVTLLDDAIREPTEAVVVTLLNPSNAVFAQRAGTSVCPWSGCDLDACCDCGTILDNDAVGLSIRDASVAENAGPINFTVELDRSTDQPVSVSYSTSDGSARAGHDYRRTSGILTIAAGATTATVAVPVIDDRLDERDETFEVVLSDATNATLNDPRARGMILDDDPLPTLSAADVTGSETSGQLDFPVSMSGPSSLAVTVAYTTADGTATATSDYQETSGALTFQPGEVAKTVGVIVYDDAEDEAAFEDFVLALSSPINAGLADSSATGRIEDDDGSSLAVTVADASVSEAVGALAFAVTLAGMAAEDVEVDYETVAETATDGADFSSASGTVTFAVGETGKTIRIDVLDDELHEADETLRLRLSGADDVSVGDAAKGTIIDDDPAPALSVAGSTATEGDGELAFGVSVGSPAGRPVSVAYATADGTAAAGEDYEAASGTLTFAPGESAKTVAVSLLDDALHEVEESFRLELSSPVNATLGVGTAVGTILDDDPADKASTRGLVLLFESAANADRQGFVRVINHSAAAGEVLVDAIDDAGIRFGPVPLAIGAREARHFNSDDLEAGNAAKGLPDGVGPPSEGAWRLELTSVLDVEVLAYARTSDGFVTSLHDTAPATDGVHRAVFLNPGENVNQVSRLRLVNPGTANARATITGTDDDGVSSAEVVVRIPAGTAQEWTAAELESGTGTEGSLGDGDGKWRLRLTSDRPVVILSLIESSTGNLTNLSTLPMTPGRTTGSHAVPLFPSAADDAGRQGFVRVVNRADTVIEAQIEAFDDTDWEYEPLTLSVGADGVASFNSDDLELGNAAKGLSGSTGSGDGHWRLELTSEADIAVLSYVRTSDGFLTSMHDLVPQAGENRHRVVFFNPASNVDQVSVLRLVNPGDAEARARITGVDDDGVSPGTAVVVSIPAGTSRELRSTDLESGDADAIDDGALGDGVGKWRLRVSSDRPIWVMSLLENPTGHLTNLSTATDRAAP